ncbi:MAG: ester cyclase [Halobacteriales archaeon]
MAATSVNRASIDIVRAILDDWNDREYKRLNEVVVDDIVQHGPVTDVEIRGREELAENIHAYQDAVSDLTSSVNLVFADETGESVCAHFTNTGTHDGELMGISPTDAAGVVDFLGVDRVEDGRIAESEILGVMYAHLGQLGTLPEIGPHAE